ncbi:hypothetical protein AUQ43_09345 [Thalassospira sp. MCCC 1A01148]|uniref:Uncharacterized protein n=1 Tax=Thalassospira profundimaris TaxID=502049 RepID=A0A367VJC6_9PROT|nr:hypothetical protein AUQ43_09345 [Thalassospira sp. MCCC 1A01148]RCK25325.1 hypothetical protein TH6_01495 [Thalassospira profundimaris]
MRAPLNGWLNIEDQGNFRAVCHFWAQCFEISQQQKIGKSTHYKSQIFFHFVGFCISEMLEPTKWRLKEAISAKIVVLRRKR